jgi:hypothetical protein
MHKSNQNVSQLQNVLFVTFVCNDCVDFTEDLLDIERVIIV